jgi:hypothetical protein
MKPITDRVILNPFTSLIGIAFAGVGVWILKWSDDLSEASRVLLSILCFVISITGLGWSDKAFFKVLDYFKKRANLILFIICSTVAFGVSSCVGVSKRQIYNLLLEMKTQLDIQNNSSQIYLYENEKKAIDTDFQDISNTDLLNSINEIIPPRPAKRPNN